MTSQFRIASNGIRCGRTVPAISTVSRPSSPPSRAVSEGERHDLFHLDTAYGYHRSRQSPDDPRGQHGNALEWFDWTVFAIFAVYFSNQFFHSDNEVSNLLSTMAVFAVGFVMRPLGGLFFGLVADRRGRKFVMVLTMSLVAASSVLIAVAPTYGQVGAFASLWLLVVRCIQGLAHGGEQGGSYTYIAEVARPDNRAL